MDCINCKHNNICEAYRDNNDAIINACKTSNDIKGEKKNKEAHNEDRNK